jgi:hypothetical protein
MLPTRRRCTIRLEHICRHQKCSVLVVVLCAAVWKSRARVEGVEYDVVIDAYVAEFRAEASGTQHVSELEEKVVRLLP